jgi:hypothetical protein
MSSPTNNPIVELYMKGKKIGAFHRSPWLRDECASEIKGGLFKSHCPHAVKFQDGCWLSVGVGPRVSGP